MNTNEIIKYVDGELKLDVAFDMEKDTVWLSSNQMAILFERDEKTIRKHVNNVFKDEEVALINNTQKMRVDGIKQSIQFYSLDVIISVGYRVKSKRGIAFRRWATGILKNYMIQGYAVNEKRLEVLNRTLELQNRIISDVAYMAGIEGKDILNIVNSYTEALNLLDEYDHQSLSKPKGRKTIKYLTEENCVELIKKTCFYGQSDLFGKERDKGMLKGILNQIKQNVFGQELYPTIEEKASNLLYMLVKDHIYFDGNKRIASIIFLEFLNQNNILHNEKGEKIISNGALVATVLMIACSRAEEKEIITGVVNNLLSNSFNCGRKAI